MSRHNHRLLLALCALFLLAGSAKSAPEPNEKAARYLQILQERPESGYLFDRFYNAWLQSSTLKELEAFLSDRSEHSDDARATVLLALFHEKQGSHVKALTLYSDALLKSPGSAEILYRKANLEAFTLNFESAITDLNSALQTNPPEQLNTKIYKLLGKIYLRNDQEEQALATWRTLLEKSPNDLDLKEDIVELQLAEGLFTQAASGCKELISASKTNYKAMMLQLRLGDIYQRAGKKDDALNAYRTSLDKIGSGSWLEQEVLSQIEQIFRAEDDITGLKEYYDKMMASYPKRVGLLKRRANVLHESGDTEKALQAFLEVVRLTPGDRNNKIQYVNLLIKAQKFDKAAAAAGELAKQYPADGEIIIKLATIQSLAGNAPQAGQTMLKYLETSDKSEFAYMRTARLLVSFKQNSPAGKVYEEMLAAFPKSVKAKEARANHLYTIGQKDQGRDALLAIADGAKVEVVIRMAKIISSHGDRQAAYDLLKKRQGDFDENYTFMTHLGQVAGDLKKTDEVLDYALMRLNLSTHLSQLEAAIADAYYAAKKTDKTESLIEQLLGQAQRSIGQSCLLVELLDQTDQPDKADSILNAAIKADPKAVLLWGQKYRLARSRQDWEQAMAGLERLIELQPIRRTMYLRRLIRIAGDTGDNDRALQALERWKKLSPNSYLPYISEARIYHGQDDTDRAVKTLRSASLKFPQSEQILRQLAQYYAFDGQYEAASRVYWGMLEKATDLSGRLALVTELARTAEMQGKTESLIRHFQTRMSTNRKSVFPPLALASIHRQLGNYDERRRYLLKASEMRSSDVNLLHEIARIEESEGEYERAQATMERASVLDKTSRSKRNLVRLYFRTGQEEKGHQLLMQLLAGKLGDPKTAESVADTLIAASEYQKAIEILQNVMPSFDKNYRLGFLYAVALEESEQTAQSIDAFVALLQIKDEIPGHTVSKATGPLGQISSYMQAFSGVVPKGVIELLEQQYMQFRVYSYRQGRGMSFGGLFGASGTTTIPLPTSIEELPGFVVGHLASLAGGLEQEEIDNLVHKLQAQGVQHAELKLQMNAQMMYDASFWANAHEKHPDDEVVAAMWLLSSMNSQAMGNEELRQVFDQFKDKWTQLACMAVITSAGRGDIDEALFDEALDLLDKVEKPNSMILTGLVQGLAMGMRDPEQANPQLQKKLTKLLLNLYSRMPRNQPFSPYVFQMVAYAIAQNEDYQGLIDLLDAEVASGSKSVRSAGIYAAFMRGTQGQLIQPLAFPPTRIPGFPESVLSFFQEEASFFSAGAIELDPQKLGAHLERIKSPVLKILMLADCEKDDQAAAAIDALLAKPKPKLGHYLLAAAWKIHKELPKEAIEILKKARYLPMKQADRRAIDSAILAHAMELENDEQARALAVQTALRVRRWRLTSEQRSELAEILEELGLTKEAEKLAKSAGASSGPRSFPGYPGRVGVSTDKVTELLEKGKRDQALKLLARQYRTLFRQVLRPSPQMGFGGNYEMRQFVQVTMSNSLTDALLAELTPSEDNRTARKLVELAYACEKLMQKDRAKEIYDEILTLKPDSWFTKLRLAMMLVESDLEKASEYFRSAAEKKPDRVGSILAQEFEHDTPIKHKLNLTELAIPLVGSPKGKSQTRFMWVHQIGRMLEQQSWTDGENLPGIFDRSDEQNIKLIKLLAQTPEQDQPAKEDLLLRRLRLYRKFCDETLKTPEMSRQAFSRKANLLRIYGGSQEKLFKDAQTAIIAGSKNTLAQPFMLGFRFFGSNSDLKEIWPESFLVAYAQKQKKQAQLDAFLAQLDAVKYKQVIKRIAHFATLYQAQGEEFLTATRQCLKDSPKYGPFSEDDALLCQVITIWSEQQKKVSLTPLILERTKKALKTNPGMGMGSKAPGEWARQVFKSQGQQAGMEYLDQLSRLFIKRSDTKKPRPRKRSSGFGPSSRQDMLIMAYTQLLEQLLDKQEPTLFWAVVMHATELPELWEQEHNQLTYRFRELEELADEWKLLEKSPLLKDWDDFRTILLPDDRSVLQILSRAIRKDTHDRKETLAQLKKITPPTFGSGLFIVLIENPEPQKVFEYLGEHLEPISNSDEARKKDLVLGLRSVFAEQAAEPKTVQGEKAQAVLVLYKQTLTNQGPTVSPLAKLKERKIRMNNLDEYAEFASRLIARTITVDRAMADEMFTHAVKAIQKFGRRLPSYSSSTNYYLSEMVEGIVEANDSLPVVKFVLEKIQAKDTLFRIDNTYQLEEALDDDYRQRHDRIKDQLKETLQDEELELEITKKLLLEYAEIFGSIHVPGIGELVEESSLESEQLTELLSWIKQQDKPDSLLMNEIAVWVEMEIQSQGRRPKSLPESFVAFYKKLITDENISPYHRLEIYTELAYECARHPQWDALTFPAAKVLNSIADRIADDNYNSRDALQLVASGMLHLQIDEHWKEVATELCAMWRKKAFAARRVRMSGGVNRSALTMLDMHLKLGDQANVQRILSRRALGLGQAMNTYVILLQYPDQKDWIIENFQKNWRQISPAGTKGGRGVNYALTPQMRIAADQIIAAIEPGEVQYLLDVIYASFPLADSPLLRSRPRKKVRQPRMNELLDRFGQIEFQDDLLRTKCLTLLPYDSKLKHAFAEFYDQREPLALALDQRSQASIHRTRYMMYLSDMLADGKLDKFKAKLAALRKPGQNPGQNLSHNSWQIKQMIEKVYQVAGVHLFGKSSKKTLKWANSPAELLAFATELSLMDIESPTSNNRLHRATLILHYICNQPAQANKMFPFDESREYEHLRKNHSHDEISVMGSAARTGGYVLLRHHACRSRDYLRLLRAALETPNPNLEDMAKGLIALCTSREGTHYFHKLGNSASVVLSKLTKMDNNANYNQLVALVAKMEESKKQAPDPAEPAHQHVTEQITAQPLLAPVP